MIKIKLNKNEYKYLCEMNYISDNYNIIASCQEKDSIILECSEDQADAIRDKLGERLQFIGFDEKYELTLEGKIIEDLVDKFFVK